GLLRTARGSREAHFQRLLRAVHLHNELAAEAAEVRDRRTAPRTSLVGMELPMDHDLKV
ncbi:MAG: hypothetical protein GWN54_16175, partial [Gammaproteobacteria bacterium]|nr:hypothetical protein [Gammaproteobacteria bacterium]